MNEDLIQELLMQTPQHKQNVPTYFDRMKHRAEQLNMVHEAARPILDGIAKPQQIEFRRY